MKSKLNAYWRLLTLYFIWCWCPAHRASGAEIVDASVNTFANLNQIAFGGGHFLVVGDGGITAISDDGLQWQLRAASVTAPLVGVTASLMYVSHNFVAVGSSSTNGVVQFSEDGITWSSPILIPDSALNAIAYGNGRYVAVGGRGTNWLASTSSDGMAWSAVTSTNSSVLRSIVWGGGKFVAGGDAGTISTSSNGLDWSSESISNTNIDAGDIISLAYGNAIFGASLNHATWPYSFATSTNGSRWYLQAPSTGYVGRCAFGGGRFMGINSANFITTSIDGMNWTLVWGHGGASLPEKLDMAYGTNVFVTVGQQGVIWYLNANYVLAGSRNTNGLYELTLNWGGGMGEGGRIQSTIDLSPANWTDLIAFTNQLSTMTFLDSYATNSLERFYRVVAP